MIINMNTQELPQETVAYGRSYYYASYAGVSEFILMNKSTGEYSCALTFPLSSYSQALGVIGYYYISSTNERVFGENLWLPAMRQNGKSDISSEIRHTFGTDSVIANNIPASTVRVVYRVFYKY